MQDNSNSNCSGGLEVVKLVKKRACPGVKISIYKATFGTVLKAGTATTTLSKDLVGIIIGLENLKCFGNDGLIKHVYVENTRILTPLPQASFLLLVMSVQWSAQIMCMFKRSSSQFMCKTMSKSGVLNPLSPGTHIMFASKLRILLFRFIWMKNLYLPPTFLYSVIKTAGCCKRCWYTIITKNENLYQVRTPLSYKLSSLQGNNLPDIVTVTGR